jgi:uncharacterized membrane protein
MPEQIAIHWNIRGEVDGYLAKFWALFLMPFLSLGIFLLFLAIPKVDPLKHNIEKFRNYYDGLIVAVLVFLLYLDSLVISWNMGFRFSMFQALAPAIGVLFYYLGVLTENAKRNWFVGIRTPWTLSNENVWDKTHKLGGKLFKIIGVLIGILGFFFEQYFVLLILAFVLIDAAFVTIYSYFEYKKQLK